MTQSPSISARLKSKPVIGAAIAVVVLIILFAAFWLPSRSAAHSVHDTCAEPGGDLSVSGRTLHLGSVDYDSGDRQKIREGERERECVVEQSGMPTTVFSRMMLTGTDVGKGEASWGDWDASWTYDLDDGLQLTLKNLMV